MTSGVLLLALSLPTRAESQVALPRWMSGCWTRRTASSVITEQWSIPRAGMMLGAGHTTRGVSTVEYEQTRIYARGAQLVYDAHPSGQPSAEFVGAASDTLLVFANPTHDFPQRVIYRRRGADSLLARIEGRIGGKDRAVDFPYARTRCE